MIYYVSLENKMDTNNVAIVLAPNLVSSPSYDAEDYSQILTEMEITNRLVELLIINVNDVFWFAFQSHCKITILIAMNFYYSITLNKDSP